jgi:hypothetical protein
MSAHVLLLTAYAAGLLSMLNDNAVAKIRDFMACSLKNKLQQSAKLVTLVLLWNTTPNSAWPTIHALNS